MRLGRALSGALLVALGVHADPSSGSPQSAAPPGGAEALQATIEVERVLLKEDQGRHERTAAERAAVESRLQELYGALDAALKRDTASASSAIDEAAEAVEAAERERASLLTAERVLVERIRDRSRRVALLEERLASLQARAEVAAGPLTGRWDVTFLPLGQRGTFSLVQNGTLVSGTYVLDGGWSGSLQGTLVNRKVYLQRIDSKLGHSADYEGYLSSEEDRIRGTWSSYEVSSAAGATGQWSAVRRASSP